MFQIWRNVEQTKTMFEDSLTKEYREIIRRIPYKAFVGGELEGSDKEIAYNEIFNYMDLCNEQIFLRSSGRVRKKTWINWQDGMKTNFSITIFSVCSKEVFDVIDNNFDELKKVQESEYSVDPKEGITSQLTATAKSASRYFKRYK